MDRPPTRHPCFSCLNDPIPDGEKPQWVSAKTGIPFDHHPAIIPRGFNRWAQGKPTTRGSVMILLCVIGQYRFKANMNWLARKCSMTARGLRNVIRDLEKGGWIIRSETKRGGTLSGWNLFTIPHLSGENKTPDYRRNGRSAMVIPNPLADEPFGCRPEPSDNL